MDLLLCLDGLKEILKIADIFKVFNVNLMFNISVVKPNLKPGMYKMIFIGDWKKMIFGFS